MTKTYSILLFVGVCVAVGFATRKRLLLNDPEAIMNRLDELEHKVQKQELEISQLKNEQNATKPAFFAVISNPATFGNAQILKFDTVKTNIGGGYDPITGVFIAPKVGIYHFTSVVYSNDVGQDIEAQMNKNTEALALGYSSAASHAESHTMNVVTSLKKGDHIYVQHRGSAVDVARGASHSTFSGFQI